MINRPHDARPHDAGAAVVEFVVLALVVTVPVAFALGGVVAIVDARMHAQSAATSAALVVARYGGGQARAERVVRSHWEADATTRVTCVRWCGEPDATVTIAVSLEVPVPFLPRPVTVTQEHTQVVDRFGSH